MVSRQTRVYAFLYVAPSLDLEGLVFRVDVALGPLSWACALAQPGPMHLNTNPSSFSLSALGGCAGGQQADEVNGCCTDEFLIKASVIAAPLPDDQYAGVGQPARFLNRGLVHDS